ncbi:hypothetical protein SAMN02990966_04629 [Rhodospirillales bacterium URHD0017]|nr:hypothetical protein SAMN02990966_04629 [Rhodospirillales bacterium URHD0017]
MERATSNDGQFTPAYWRERAEEARVLAEEMKDRDTRAMMTMIAETYERMATLAELREDREPGLTSRR